MATTVKESFRQYAQNLNITDKQETKVSNCKNNVTDVISKKLSLHSDGGRVIGSWDRDTMIRYLSEGDVDLMVVLHHGDNKDWDNNSGPDKALDKFKSILDDKYSDTTIRKDRNCVSMQLSEFTLDVVPAFKYDTGNYRIPDTYRGVWVSTNPIEFAKKITAVNKTMDGCFVPLIKMVKGWNRERGWPIRSFHLETMIYEHYKNYEKAYTYDSTLKVFFNDLPGYLRSPCYDPVTSDRLDGYLDNGTNPTKRTEAIEKAERAASKTSEAMEYTEAGKEQKAIEIWESLLGEFFPAYG